MKRQINFCLFILVLTFTGLIVFLIATKNTPTTKTLRVSWTLLNIVSFSLLVFCLGYIHYAKQKYIEVISSDTSAQEAFLRIEAISYLPKKVRDKLGDEKLKALLIEESAVPVSNKEKFEDILNYASQILSQELKGG